MNTRRLIEGLYRQKFNLENEMSLLRKEREAKEGKEANSGRLLEISHELSALHDQKSFIDELLIDFFGE